MNEKSFNEERIKMKTFLNNPIQAIKLELSLIDLNIYCIKILIKLIFHSVQTLLRHVILVNSVLILIQYLIGETVTKL